MNEFTITEAAKKYGIPRSRIVRAIERGWLKSFRQKRLHILQEDELEIALKRRMSMTREERHITVTTIDKLCTTQRIVEKFETNAAADEYTELFKKQPNTF